jgi:hypothetical protein
MKVSWGGTGTALAAPRSRVIRNKHSTEIGVRLTCRMNAQGMRAKEEEEEEDEEISIG